MSIAWIAVDWGTSNLRIWAMDEQDNVVAEKYSDQGMGLLKQSEYELVLLSYIKPWLELNLSSLPMPVLACGMVGSRQGWLEAPYDMVPTKPAMKTVAVETKDSRINVRIISGISQAEPVDVMRGEEVQIAGFLTNQPDYEGAICLPGTHSKWVFIKNGQVVQFHTALTGELYALISQHSILSHSMGDWSDDCFKQAIQAAFQDPKQFSIRLFEIRAKNLIEKDNCGASRLSAVLIGTELAATSRYWQGQQVTVIGASELARLYGLALETVGGKVNTIQANALTLAGLCQIKRELFNA